MFRLLYLLCAICLAKAGTLGGIPCDTVDLEAGKCINLTDCPPLFDIMKIMPLPFTKTVTDYLQRSYCGRAGKVPMVCCPFKVNGRGTYGDLSTHKNVHLLTKKICGKSSTVRIAGGTEAHINEFPWMALLIYDKGNLCGGSVINERYVVTAAHCITNRLLKVRVGEHTISNVSDCDYYMNKQYCAPPYQDLGIEKVTIHEMFQSQKIVNDVALIRVASPIDFSVANAMPICLPIYGNLRNDDFVGKMMTVAGWGFTEKEKQSDVLLQVGIKVISNKECKARYRADHIPGYIMANKMCAGTVGQDSCRGDSGGPLMYLGTYNNSISYILQGIVSYGSWTCGSGTPGVYVRVTDYVKWILDNIEP